MTRTCAFCIFARPSEKEPNKVECHFNPPVVGAQWPLLDQTDWCGRWSNPKMTKAKGEIIHA